MKRDIFLGVDLGGTNIVLAGVTSAGEIIKRLNIPTPQPASPKKVVEAIVAGVKTLTLDLSRWKIRGLGIGCAGDVDYQKGMVRFSPNLGWRNVCLVRELAKKISLPIVMDNDANVAALGAYYLEGKNKIKNLVCVTLGTGVGGGLIFDGRLYRGATGSAGEIGHLTLDPHGPLCKCGNNGCLERYVGAAYLSKIIQYRLITKEGKKSLLYHWIKNKSIHLSPRTLSKAAQKGDKLALRLWQEIGENLGIAMAGIVNLLNPEMIVFSGGVSRAQKFFLPALKKVLSRRAFNTPVKAAKIIITKHSQNLGVVGAALLNIGDGVR
ncbi:MAG: ROK family protein [Elusimicrobiota bacterium]